MTRLVWLSVAAAALLVWALGAATVLGRFPAAWLPLGCAVIAIAVVALIFRGRLQPGSKAALGAAAIALVVSTVSGRSMTAFDTQPASELPWEMLRHGSIFLDDAPVLREFPDSHWIFRRADGRVASWYPPGSALVALPVYLPTVLAKTPSRELLSQFEKSASSFLSALTVLILCFALARARTSPRWIFAGGLLYGLGSSALSLLSQALWQQTACALAVALMLFAALEPEERSSLVCACLAGGIVLASRAPDLILIAPFLWAARSRRLLFAALAGAFLGGLIFLAWNELIFGSPWAVGYQIGQKQLGFTTHELPESTIGIFIGYSHGLLVYVPWLLLLPAVLRVREPAVRASLASAALLVALMSFWWCWWGAGTYGPRMMSEVQVVLAFAVTRAAVGWARPLRIALAGLGVAAFATHAAYVFWLSASPAYSCDGPWNEAAYPLVYWLR